MKQNQYNKSSYYKETNDEEEINIRLIIEQYLYYWKWFLLSVLICVFVAFLYIRYTKKIYAINAQILLNEKSTTSPELAALSDAAANFTGEGSNAVVNDQIKILKSRRLMYKTVKSNKLNVNYFIKGTVNNTEVLANNSPVTIQFLQDTTYVSDHFKGKLQLQSISNAKFKITDSDFIEPGEYAFNKKISSKLGEVRINKTTAFKNPTEVVIVLQPIMQTVLKFQRKLAIDPDSDKKSMIVNFAMQDNNKERGSLVINAIISNYNLETIDDGTKLAKATTAFINERLKLINTDLASVDKKLQKYKATNSTNNTQTEANVFLNDALNVDKQVIEFTAQLQIAQHLTNTLAANKNALLPSNIGISDPALSNTINNYNALVLEKQEYSKSMKPSNPVMLNLVSSIDDLGQSIQNSLHLYQNNIKSSLQIVQNKKDKLNDKLNQLPEQERGFRDIARQQQIVESIYLFLLQKREEAEIKASASIDSVKIIDEPFPSEQPVSPKPIIIFLAALIIGLVIPFACIYIVLLLNNKIKDNKDFIGLFDGAFLGDVPKSKMQMIKLNDRSALAEAMRIIRSNINFILPKNTDSKVIFITSTIPGEGKTFFSVNLTQLLAITKKRVVLVGADIRKPRIVEYLNLDQSNTQGLTNLLAEPSLNLDQVLLKKPNELLFDVLPSGVIPPNPAELLMEPRFEEIIDELKKQYDYIIVDTAPIGMVGDTQIIADFADATIFIARSNYLDKRLTSVLQDAYKNKKLKNIGLVINDLDFVKGYGYGYGYGYGEKPEKKRFFKKS